MKEIKRYTAVFGSYQLSEGQSLDNLVVVSDSLTCLAELNATQKNRHCKWLPWLYFKMDQPMIYQDANIIIDETYLEELLLCLNNIEKSDFIFFEHECERCLREEVFECLRLGKIKYREARELLTYLKTIDGAAESTVLDFGCFISNVKPENRKYIEKIFTTFSGLPARDQIVFRAELLKFPWITYQVRGRNEKVILYRRLEHQHLQKIKFKRKLYRRIDGFLKSWPLKILN